MNRSDQPMPDEFWRKAFEEAAETPPPRVWDAIERQLDEDNGVPVIPLRTPFWQRNGTRYWAAGLAAAVALVLVGWWVTSSTSPLPTAEPALSQQPAGPRPESPDALARREPRLAEPAPAGVQPSARPAIALRKRPMPATQKRTRPATPEPALAALDGSVNGPETATPSLPVSEAGQLIAGRRAAPEPPVPPLTVAGDALLPTAARSTLAVAPPAASDELFAATADGLSESTDVTVARLAGRPVQFPEQFGVQRIVWFQAADTETEAPAEVQLTRQPREVWASLGIMPSSFNPTVAIRPMSTVSGFSPSNNTFLNTAAASSLPTVSSQPNFSMAYQAGAGLQLTERWSVETGIGYLQGRSAVESPVQQPVFGIQVNRESANAASNNLFASVVRNSSGNYTNTSADYMGFGSAGRFVANTNLYDTQNSQLISNDYRYVQVPLQAGYQLRPRKRLNIAMLGGLLTNWFVRNTVGDELVVRPDDGLYRPVTLAGTAGMRFRYRPTQRWSASLAGIYQQSLQSGTRPGADVLVRPQTIGMSFGFDYHF